MVKAVDQETIATLQFPRERGMPNPLRTASGEAPGLCQVSNELHKPEAFLWFLWEEIGHKAGKLELRFRLDSLNNFRILDGMASQVAQ